MAPMVRIGTRPGPSALRNAAAASRGGCGGCLRLPAIRLPSIRALQSRCIATDAVVREPGVELPSIPPVQTPSRQSARERIQAIDKAKPFSEFLTDNFQRQHDYLRISITERCNLRCLYCMPEEGIPLSPPATMLTTPEIVYLSSLFVSQGVTKIRLTGGEPTVRRDIVPLMQQIGSLRPKGLRELALTTNGISLHRKLDAMVEAGLTGINLSLDTLDPFQFQIMTRRKGFDAVMKSIDRILEMNKLGANVKLKVNCVVMRGLNEREILPFVEMGREKDIEVRFIEYMPFGGNKWSENKMISFQEMVDIIRTKYPGLARIPGHKNDTSKTYKVPGFVGKVGFITSMTNDFCSSCNRLRITSDGNLKVCLHGNDEVSLRDLLRQDNNNEPIDEAAFERIKQIELDRHHGRLSDSTILGWGPRERELLSVIGQAVKRKAEKHADMGDLANMQNRPMILIDQQQRESKYAATPPTHRRPRSAAPSGRTATSILASNAYLNPLLGRSLGSARAFSTTPSRDADAFDATDHRDPADDDTIAALIDKKRSNPRQKKPVPRRTSRKALQATQKPQLMHDLASLSQDTPDSADLTPEQLEAKLADLARQLEAAKQVNWDALYQDAQEARSLKNHLDFNYKNMQHSQKVTATRKLAEEYEARVKEINRQREEHQHHVSELEKSYARLKLYVERQRAGEQGEQGEGEFSEQIERREQVKRRKEEVLRKKDELEVRLARSRATQAGIQVTTPDAVGALNTLAASDAASNRSLSASSLHLDLPNGTFHLDANTTFVIHAPFATLQKQLGVLRTRLSAFHPRLDALPSDTNTGSDAAKDKYTLQTYLKVLIARYREKTGVLGVREHDAEEAEKESEAEATKGIVKAKILTQEARQRIAEKWNEMFSQSKGYVMTPEHLLEDQSALEIAEQQKPQESKAEADSKAEASRKAEASGRAEFRRHGEAAPQQRFEPEIEEFNEHGFLEDEYAMEEEARAADEAERARLLSVEPEQTTPVEGEDNAEIEEIGENGFLDELASAHEMDAEEEATERTAQDSPQSKEFLPPSNETIEADKNDQDAAPSLSSLHNVASTKDSLVTTPSHTASTPTSPQHSRRPVLPIPTPAKPKTHAYFGRRLKIYNAIEQRLRQIEKKKTVKNPVGVNTPVSPEVTSAIDAHLRDFLDEFDERLKQNKIDDHLTVSLVRRVRGGGHMNERQGGKKVSPSFWADRFGILKQERMRADSVTPSVSPWFKVVKLGTSTAQEMTEKRHPAATKATAAPPPSITTPDISHSAPAPSSRPARNDPSFAAWALHQLSGGPNTSQTSEQARETLEANYKAVKLGWGTEDDRIAAEGLPEKHRPDVEMQGYEFMGSPLDDPRESSAPTVEARVQALRGTSMETESEEDRLARDPKRKARIAAELKLLRRATTLRQDEDESEAASGEARGAEAETQKPRITYESSLQPKGFVMKKQRGAVAEQKKKTKALMKQNPVQTRLAPSSPTKVGARTQTNSQPRPRRPLTVREVMQRSYSTSVYPVDELNNALKEKEDAASAAKPPSTPSPPPAPLQFPPQAQPHPQPPPHLPHLTSSGAAHMVSISSKPHTPRTAIAVGTVYFSNPVPLSLITANALKKGDVLGVSRIAGIMAAKKCPDIVPLCHPIALTHVGVELCTFAAGQAPGSTSPAGKGNDGMGHGGVKIEAKVACAGATGVEMEALTAVMGTALSVVDMCKAVDKFQRIGDVRVVLKEGGKSGVWREVGWQSWQEGED